MMKDNKNNKEVDNIKMVWNERMNYWIPVITDKQGNKYSLSYQATGSCFVSGFIKIED